MSQSSVFSNISTQNVFNPLNAELNPICHLLALLAHHILHVSRIRVNLVDKYKVTSYLRNDELGQDSHLILR